LVEDLVRDELQPMAKHVDYYFSPASPWTYLGHPRFAAMLRRHGASVAVKPTDIGGQVFPVTGGVPVKQRSPARQAYRLAELERWRRHLGAELNLQPKHFPPAQDRLAARVMIAAARAGADPLDFPFAIMRAVWAEERDIADPATLEAICRAQGLDGAAVLAAAESDEVKAEYQANTDEAIRIGVFGAPWYAIGGEGFWGQDRLDFVERALAG
jgi:2-hydroxychromene-2-carboxylate isomerase